MTKRILTDFVIDKIAAVDRPCQEHATVTIMKREFSDKERSDMADKGEALPNGGYPIKSAKDVENAVQAFGRAKNKTKTKAHIIARAKDIGAESELPEKWMKKFVLGDLADRLAKDFFMLMPPQPADENSSDDFNEALDDLISERMSYQVDSELHDCICALRASICSIICDQKLQGNDKLLAMRNSCGQFLDAVQARWAPVPTEISDTVAASDHMNMTAFKRLTMLRADVLKVKTNEMLESIKAVGTGVMPKHKRIPRNSQPMVRAGSQDLYDEYDDFENGPGPRSRDADAVSKGPGYVLAGDFQGKKKLKSNKVKKLLDELQVKVEKTGWTDAAREAAKLAHMHRGKAADHREAGGRGSRAAAAAHDEAADHFGAAAMHYGNGHPGKAAASMDKAWAAHDKAS